MAVVLSAFCIVSCAQPLEPEGIFIRGDGGPRGDTKIANGGGDTGSPDEELGDSASPGIDSSTPVEDTGAAPVDTGFGSTPDTSIPDTGTEPIDTGVADTGTPPTDTGPGTGTTVTFPTIADSYAIVDDPWMWNKGDYIQGARTTTVSSITSISGSIGINNRLSTCGTLDVAVKINGTTVGTMKITSSSGTSYPMAFTFPAITGPKYTLRYEAMNTVASTCGSVWIDEDVTKLMIK